MFFHVDLKKARTNFIKAFCKICVILKHAERRSYEITDNHPADDSRFHNISVPAKQKQILGEHK